MSDLNNKHLPSDIDSLTRKDLAEIYFIQAEEHQVMLKEIAELKQRITELERERDEYRGALVKISKMDSMSYHNLETAKIVASEQLRKQQEGE